eukprot:259375-Chlamydomonas_euryale.AAC.3
MPHACVRELRMAMCVLVTPRHSTAWLHLTAPVPGRLHPAQQPAGFCAGAVAPHATTGGLLYRGGCTASSNRRASVPERLHLAQQPAGFWGTHSSCVCVGASGWVLLRATSARPQNPHPADTVCAPALPAIGAAPPAIGAAPPAIGAAPLAFPAADPDPLPRRRFARCRCAASSTASCVACR